MKNYLFAPFKDDKEKVEEFNHFRKYLPKGHQNRLVIFIGRLESYYDVITSKLQADESESIGWIEQYKKGCENYREEIKELKAENERLKDRVIKRGAENEDLIKACNMIRADKTSHYPKEYKKEAEEYFDHNPQCKKLLFFILDGNDFDWDEDNDGCNGMNGEYNSILFAGDCIAEFDNNTEGSD